MEGSEELLEAAVAEIFHFLVGDQQQQEQQGQQHLYLAFALNFFFHFFKSPALSWVTLGSFNFSHVSI